MKNKRQHTVSVDDSIVRSPLSSHPTALFAQSGTFVGPTGLSNLRRWHAVETVGQLG